MEEEAGNPCRQGSTGGAEQLAHPHGLDVKHLQEYKEQMSWVDAHREKNANGDCNTSSHSVPQCRWYKSAATGDSSKHRPSHEVGKNNNTYQHEQGKTARERTQWKHQPPGMLLRNRTTKRSLQTQRHSTTARTGAAWLVADLQLSADNRQSSRDARKKGRPPGKCTITQHSVGVPSTNIDGKGCHSAWECGWIPGTRRGSDNISLYPPLGRSLWRAL